MIETPESLYKYFETALNFILTGPNSFERKAIASDAKISVQYLGQILDPNNPKKASLFSQKKIAKAAGYSYEDFLEFGKKLLKSQYSSDYNEVISVGEDLQHNPIEIESLIKKTREILYSGTEYAESLSANIKSFYSAVKNKKEMNNLKDLLNATIQRLNVMERRYETDRRGFNDRRKNESDNYEFNRRSGKDRRESGT